MKRKTKRKLTPVELAQRKQKGMIRNIFNNLGFYRIKGVEGKKFVYRERTTELDDIYVLENVIVLVEYTTTNKVKEHLTKKNLIYGLINEDHEAFIQFLLDNNIYDNLVEQYNTLIKPSFRSLSQLNVRILYCSKEDIPYEYSSSIKKVCYFDYPIAYYFKYLTASLKFSARTEFLRFLSIPPERFSRNILEDTSIQEKMKAYVIPEVKTFFNDGYKVVTFYMSPEAIIKRAYVLRHEGWEDKNSAEFYQRMADPGRISKIRRFLAQEERVFVNNIIVTLSEKDISFTTLEDEPIQIDQKGKAKGSVVEDKISVVKMTIADKSNIIGIIDGQHRVYAYHEDNDILESKIARLRKQQNLLVTGILFPENEDIRERRKFEAKLFREINVAQVKIPTKLQQELEMMVNPFSSISIGKEIIIGLNQAGALEKKLELYSFEEHKVKTSSIVSFGLRPLIKYSEGDDTLFSVWNNVRKLDLLQAQEKKDYGIRDEYITFCIEALRPLFSAVKNNLDVEDWNIYSPKNKRGLLTITFINGILNMLRCIIQYKKKLYSFEEYDKMLANLRTFDFRKYKTSHYRLMGEDLYKKFMLN